MKRLTIIGVLAFAVVTGGCKRGLVRQMEKRQCYH